ncbi:MAG TPA: hypothetical protein VL401_00625 [Alphaproteobacteria bacterium]|jgi:hypothetical protein|nr:hypothetical protein [Alphaproteobacteria bacterium]
MVEISPELRIARIKNTHQAYSILLREKGLDIVNYPVYPLLNDGKKLIQYHSFTKAFVKDGHVVLTDVGVSAELFKHLLGHPNQPQKHNDLLEIYKNFHKWDLPGTKNPKNPAPVEESILFGFRNATDFSSTLCRVDLLLKNLIVQEEDYFIYKPIQ